MRWVQICNSFGPRDRRRLRAHMILDRGRLHCRGLRSAAAEARVRRAGWSSVVVSAAC